MSISRLKAQRALITGGSRGIGLAIAQRFAKEGVVCTLLGRKVDTLHDAIGTLEKHEDSKHEVIAGDVGSSPFWEELKGKHPLDFDILVNAAGITSTSLLAITPTHTIENIYNTNLLGTTLACRFVSKAMVKRQRQSKSQIHDNTGSNIVNVSSLLGTHGGAGSAVYSASKAGVLALSRALAAELRGRVRVNTLVPGYIESDMTSGMDDKRRESLISKIPAGRFGTCEEVAEAALFLVTNPYANNCVITLDGGLSANV